MTKREREYLNNKYYLIDAQLHYVEAMYHDTKQDHYSAMADVYSSQLVLLRQIFSDLDIVIKGGK